MAIETEERPERRNENLVDSFRRRLKGRALDRAKGFPRRDVTSLSSIRVRAKNLIFRRRKQTLLLRIVSSHRIVSVRELGVYVLHVLHVLSLYRLSYVDR
jgi:hypothetical protein